MRREVGCSRQPPREADRVRVSVEGRPIDLRAAGVRQRQQTRHLVERLAHRVVDRAAQALVAPDAPHGDALAMPARHQEQQVRERRAAVHQAGQPGGERVRFQVVDRDERQAGRERDTLGDAGADDQPADQPGAAGRGDAAEVANAQARARQGAPDEVRQVGEVGARRDLGHDAAEPGVLVLGQHRFGQDAAVGRENRRGRLVAGRFDP